MLALNAVNIPTIGAGAHFGSSPPPGWDLHVVSAVPVAEYAQQAEASCGSTSPKDGEYEVAPAEPYGRD